MTELRLFNTLSKEKERFVPGDPQRVTMYVCGPTVYSYAHIGNARGPVIFDILHRLLKTLYPQVIYAKNITDVDDKINQAAMDEGVDISVIAQRFTASYHEEMAQLGVARPDLEPHATHHMPEMIQMIERLIARDHAYLAAGHVLFRVASYANYGNLSRRDTQDCLAGARVEVADYKESPGDFVLWKPSTENTPGWDSPWGRGRPGWHLECSAMIEAHLGNTIDIHGGGMDLVFPHHENEIAQSCCAHDGQPFVRYWMHHGFLDMNKEKMAKSLGNVALIHDLLKLHRGEVLRFVLFSSHYRKPLDWNDEVIDQAKRTLDRLYNALRDMADIVVEEQEIHLNAEFRAALHDDLNTPKALAALANLTREANTTQNTDARAQIKAAMLGAGRLLGILQQDPDRWFRSNATEETGIQALVEERETARAAKNYSRSDQIRDQLKEMGVEIEDRAGGTRWRKV